MRGQRDYRRFLAASLVTAFLGVVCAALAVQPGFARKLTLPNLFPFVNDSGILQTYNNNGPIDLNGPFFQSLGTNGRSCASCHLPDQGWSISADRTKARFIATAGLDPIFRTNDGSNCDHDIDTSTLEGRRRAYSLLISRGLIRVEIPAPANAEFEVTEVNNPYGCSETTTLSTYRRVLPSTNLRFISAVMWDGRQSTPPSTEKITYVTNPNDLLFDLRHQAMDATNGHAQGLFPLSAEQEHDIVNFEMGLSTAQVFDFDAGLLTNGGAKGGPVPLSTQHFFIGINDPLGENPFGTPFTPGGIWLVRRLGRPPRPPFQAGRARIARGEALFNSKPIHITGVAGLNDDLGIADIPGNMRHVSRLSQCRQSLGTGSLGHRRWRRQ